MPDGFNEYFLSTLGSHQYEERNGDLYYKWYPQLMAQITKYFRTWSIYIGAENMTNFRQDSPVIGADTPFAKTLMPPWHGLQPQGGRYMRDLGGNFKPLPTLLQRRKYSNTNKYKANNVKRQTEIK